MSGKINNEIEEFIRDNVTWQNLPIHLKQVLKNSPKNYENYIFNYSLKNQLRFKGNLVRQIFRDEKQYYELLVDKSVKCLCLFPYHLADIVSKGLRVTPFNYYIDVLCYLLRNDKSYDTLPNFTAADCLRVLGIGRNEYLALIGELKSNSSRLFRKPNPQNILPRLPVKISIESWWKVEIGYVLETDVKYLNAQEIGVLDDLIDFGSLTAGKSDYTTIQSLYKKGLIYLDVPISGEDKICIPPLKNFVMNRVSGDYFENLLYKIFVSVDEHMSISELAHMLRINLDTVKHAISLFCRLGFARKKTDIEVTNLHMSWLMKNQSQKERPEVTPLNFHALLVNETNTGFVNSNGDDIALQNVSLNENLELKSNTASSNIRNPRFENSSNSNESDGNISDFSIICPAHNRDTTQNFEYKESPNSNRMDGGINIHGQLIDSPNVDGKRVLLLFDATLTAFLMMGNLSPGLKNHAVTMYEVGKICDESMDTFLSELEKVSLLDAEGEGEVSRYFAHAVILRSTIISLRNIVPAGIDLLRLECLEKNLDYKTRDRFLEMKYKFIISVAPLSGSLTNFFTIPFFGQFHKSFDNSHIWSKLFYYHISGYGLPSLLLIKGTVLKSLPNFLLGYGKLLITTNQPDSYIINSENFKNLNDQLKNSCILIQAYGIKSPAEIHYESFPFNHSDLTKAKWINHHAISKLENILNLKNTCGYITFVNTGVPDFGCDEYVEDVQLEKAKKQDLRKLDKKRSIELKAILSPSKNAPELLTPGDGSEITSFNVVKKTPMKTLNEEHYFEPTENQSPSNEFRSEDCNEILTKELDDLVDNPYDKFQLVSQSSVEIEFSNQNDIGQSLIETNAEEWTLHDVHYGIPLFDIDCNTRICEEMVKRLSKDEILHELSVLNSQMNERFTKFILQCLHFEDEKSEHIRIGKIPQPRINLIFENGKVSCWNGK